MSYLLDTHVWIQRALGLDLPPLVDDILYQYEDSLAISDISIWEAAKLIELGRLKLEVSPASFFQLAITPSLKVIPITPEIAIQIVSLESTGFHKDPADQLIVATALTHKLHLISADSRIRKWGQVPMVWRTYHHPEYASKHSAIPPTTIAPKSPSDTGFRDNWTSPDGLPKRRFGPESGDVGPRGERL